MEELLLGRERRTVNNWSLDIRTKWSECIFVKIWIDRGTMVVNPSSAQSSQYILQRRKQTKYTATLSDLSVPTALRELMLINRHLNKPKAG